MIPSSPLLSLFAPFFWPSATRDRALAVACVALLLASRIASVCAPLLLADGVNAAARGSLQLSSFLLFGIVRFGATVCQELQRVLFLRVKENAAREASTRVFRHIHSLGVGWFIAHPAGVVLKALDEGVAATSTLVTNVIMRLLPSALEVVALSLIFVLRYRSWPLAVLLCSSFTAYLGSAYALTRANVGKRRGAAASSNDAAKVAADSLGNNETVKLFGGEERETERYSAAIGRRSEHLLRSRSADLWTSLVRDGIVRATMVAALLLCAVDVAAGRSSIGELFAVQAWVTSLFAPLDWVGALFSLVLEALGSLGALGDILAAQPEVLEAPGATPLDLGERAGEGGADAATGGAERKRAGCVISRDEEEGVVVVVGGDNAAGITTAAGAVYGARVDFCDVSFGYAHRTAPTAGALPAGAAFYAAAPSRHYWWGWWGRAWGWWRGSSAYAYAPLSVGGAAAIPPVHRSAHESLGDILLDASASDGGGGNRGGLPSPLPPLVLPPLQLRHISFSVPAGSTTAIVGATGAGKSTLARLLCRLYNPASGTIVINGRDIAGATLASLRAAVCVVPQEVVLFNETLR